MASWFTVEMHLLPTSEGGRQAPIRSGHNALVRLGNRDHPGWGWGVHLIFDAPPVLAAGDSGLVRVPTWANTLPPEAGTVIHLYEGERLIGTGTVSE